MNAAPRPRNLTDADVEAIVDRFNAQFEQTFYKNIGKGIWRFAWAGILAIVLALAAFGHFGSK